MTEDDLKKLPHATLVAMLMHRARTSNALFEVFDHLLQRLGAKQIGDILSLAPAAQTALVDIVCWGKAAIAEIRALDRKEAARLVSGRTADDTLN